MEIVVHIESQEFLDQALNQGVGAVAVPLPRNPDAQVWSELTEWRTAAQKRGTRFYLVWDRLLTEEELPGVADNLAELARLNPDGVQLRDLGLVEEARRLCPGLTIHAAAKLGVHNSPGVRLAESLGFSRVVLEGPVSLKDLALMRRQTNLPLAFSLPPFCQGYASLCLLEEYLGSSCETCCLSGEKDISSKILTESLEMFSGLCQLGVEAVQIRGELFPSTSLGQVIGLYQSVAEASPMERPRVLAAVRQVLGAFGEGLVRSQPQVENVPNPTVHPQSPFRRNISRAEYTGRGRIWVEARDYAEAMALSRGWREPLVIVLTPGNYGAFLQDHRRWGPRRLIWRMPFIISESSLSFYQKSLETLSQGGYNRFVAGDWGAVALIRRIGGQVYGDQTLGVRNSRALRAAKQLKVARVCLPSGLRPERWQELLKASPTGSFWGYLYQVAPLARCLGETPGLLAQDNLRWVSEDGMAILGFKDPLDLRDLDTWLNQQGIFPLIVSLLHSPIPRGQLPDWLSTLPKKSFQGK